MPTNFPFGFIPCQDGASEAVPRKMTVTTGQTIKVGDPVYVSSGLVTLGTTTTPRFCGVAAEACASAPAGTQILVYTDPKLEFRIQASGAAMAEAKIGNLYDLGGSSGVFTANLNAQTIGCMKLIGYESLGTYGICRVKLARHQFDTSEGLTVDTVTLENGNTIANPAGGTVTVDADFQPVSVTASALVKGADLECTDDLTVGDAIVAAKYCLPYNATAAQAGTFNLAALPSGIVTLNNSAAPVIVQFGSAVKGIWYCIVKAAVDGANTVKFDVDSSGGDLSYAGAGDITLSGATDIGKVVLVIGDGTKYAIRSL